MVVSDSNQLQKFENDDVAQYYFEILRQLIAKKSIFAQQIGLAEVANYLGDIFTEAGAEVTIDDTCTAPFVLARFRAIDLMLRRLFFTTIMILCQLMMTSLGRQILLN